MQFGGNTPARLTKNISAGKSPNRKRTKPSREVSSSEASFLQVGVMLGSMAIDFSVHSHSPNRQRNLWGNTVRLRAGGFVCLTYASKNVQGPIFEEETARGGSFRRGTEHCSYPVTSYVTVVIFYSWVTLVLDSIRIRKTSKPTDQ